MNNQESLELQPVKDNSETGNLPEQSSDDENGDPHQSQSRLVRIVTAVVVILVLIVGVALLLLFILPSPYPDDDLSTECRQLPPRFGNKCQYRCHCLNLTEICDKKSGRCNSGCMHGWLGENCQIISSIFDKSTINSRSQSRHSVTCSIYKLWYIWTNIYLAFNNGTGTYIIVNISRSDVITVSDQRVNATLQKNILTDEADTVSFVFVFNEDDCGLTGSYTCQFEMMDHFDKSFANLSLLTQAPPTITEFKIQDKYYKTSNHSFSCTVTFDDNTTTDLELNICHNNSYKPIKNDSAFTLTFSSDAVSVGKCTRQKLLSYTFDFNQVPNGTFLRCMATDHSLNKTVVTDCSPLVLQYPVLVKMKPTVFSLRPYNTSELVCFIHYRGYRWSSVNILQKKGVNWAVIVSVLREDIVISNNSRINGSVSISEENINLTLAFDAHPGAELCQLNQTYVCDISLKDSLIGTIAASSEVILEIPVTDVGIQFQSQYQYGNMGWINCTANMIDPSTVTMSLEVCYNGSIFLPTEVFNVDVVSALETSNCSVHKKWSHRFILNSQTNVSVRCRVDDYTSNISATSSCILPNILTPFVQIILLPKYQVSFIGSTVEMFCLANVSNFIWKVIHLDFVNSSSSQRLVSVWHNEKNKLIGDQMNATVTNINTTVNVSYILNISEAMACLMDGQYSCDIEFFDDVIQTTSDGGVVFVTAWPDITEFKMEDYYYSISNHSLSCTAAFGGNSTTYTEIQFCHNNSYDLINDDPAFSLSLSSRNKALGICSHQMTVLYTFDFTQVNNGTLLRCFAIDQNLNLTKATKCFPLILQTQDINVKVEPKYQIKTPESTVEIICHANVSAYKWKVVHLDYTNGSTTQRIMSVFPTDSNTIFGNEVNATVISKDENINISFVLRMNEDVTDCNIKVELSCSIEFLDKNIEGNDIGTIIIKAPPTNLSIELENEYVEGIDASINCTAVVNPNRTVVFLVGKGRVGAMPTVAPTTGTQRIAEQSSNDNCDPQVRIVYQADFTFLKDNNILACMVYDVDYNRNYTSNFKTASIYIIS